MAYDQSWVFDALSTILTVEPTTTLGGACDRLGIDRHTGQRAIRSAGVRSYARLRNDALCRAASTLFSKRPGLTIKEVAVALGFQSARAFSKRLKAAAGQTPREVRGALRQSAV